MKMKLGRIFLLVALILVSEISYAQTILDRGICGDNANWTLYDNGELVIAGTGEMTDFDFNAAPWLNKSVIRIIIEEGITRIGTYSFSQCKSIVSVTCPETLTSIGEGAFWMCDNLQNINIPDEVTTIEGSALYHCTRLAKITIPRKLRYIGEGAFCDCTNITSLFIPKECPLTSIGGFGGCTNLKNVTLSETIKRIEEGAFNDCSSLANIIIPKGVVNIGGGAFRGTGIASINIPAGVETIGEGILSNCTNLNSIVVEKENKIYDSRNNCNAIIETETNTLIAGCQNTTIPKDINCIGSYAFQGFTGLSTIIIPESVLKINDNAFQGSGIEYLNIPNSVTEIGWQAFSLCKNLTRISLPSSLTDLSEWSIFAGCAKLKSISIPEGVKLIGYGAFSGCRNLTSIIIPSSVTTIEYYSFEHCSNIEYIICLAEEPPFVSSPFERTTGFLMVPNESISAYQEADYWKDFLNIVGVPNMKGDCGTEATWEFSLDGTLFINGSGKMTNYAAAEDVPWNQLCPYITKIVISDNITRIGNNAFTNCSIASSIYCSAEMVPAIGANALSNMASEGVLTVPYGLDYSTWMEALGSGWKKEYIEGTVPIFSVQVNCDDNGTAYLSSDSVPGDNTVTLTIKPNGDYEIKRVLMNSVDITNEVDIQTGSVTKVVLEDIVFHVQFEYAPAFVTITQDNNSSIIQKASLNKPFTLYIEPEEGYTIDSVHFNGIDMTSKVGSDGLFVTPPLGYQSEIVIKYVKK